MKSSMSGVRWKTSSTNKMRMKGERVPAEGDPVREEKLREDPDDVQGAAIGEIIGDNVREADGESVAPQACEKEENEVLLKVRVHLEGPAVRKKAGKQW
jgi:hypothetical protein